jgi:hypothetical protein
LRGSRKASPSHRFETASPECGRVLVCSFQ